MKFMPLVYSAILTYLLAGCSLVKYTIEHAPYTLVKSEENFEIRYYSQILLVSTPMNSEKVESSSDSAFKRLFAYISGENSEAQDISMTAPVFMDQNKATKMSFVLPKDFRIDSAPAPNDPNVSLEKIDNYTVAVIRFSGWLDQETIEIKKVELMDWLRELDIKTIGLPIIAGYDPPSSLPFFRRNEVLIPIEWSQHM
jgi:hypothetical protein